jgi:hypothetical protein
MVSASGCNLRHFASASALPSFFGHASQKATKPGGSFAGRSGGAAAGLSGVGGLEGGVILSSSLLFSILFSSSALYNGDVTVTGLLGDGLLTVL